MMGHENEMTMQTSTLPTLALSVLCASLVPSTAWAGHADSPHAYENPATDLVDLYLFRSPDLQNTITMAMTVWPFQSPSTGPEQPSFSPDLRYSIKVDSNGDAREDIIFEFRFRTEKTIGDQTFQYARQIQTVLPPDQDWYVRQYMTVTHVEVETNTRSVLVADQIVAPHYLGATTPNYGALVTSAIAEIVIPGGFGNARVFAGPRDDPFFADWGAISDGLRRRPPNSGNAGGGVDHFSGLNVLAIVLQVPIRSVTLNRNQPTMGQQTDAMVGVWGTVDRRQVSIVDQDGLRHHGPWRQVNRIGLPLVNTFLTPSNAKNGYNRSAPINDLTNIDLNNQLTDPVLAAELAFLNPVEFIVVPGPRTDLLGLLAAQWQLGQTVTETNYLMQVADILRLDVTLAGSDVTGNSSRMGMIADQPGYPNGRRLFDDVVDITFQLISGNRLGAPFDTGLNGEIGDGTDQNDVPFANVFPYLATPHAGNAIGLHSSPAARN